MSDAFWEAFALAPTLEVAIAECAALAGGR